MRECEGGHTHREIVPVQYATMGTQLLPRAGIMASSDAKLRALKPADKTHQAADEGGLCLVVHPSGTKTW